MLCLSSWTFNLPEQVNPWLQIRRAVCDHHASSYGLSDCVLPRRFCHKSPNLTSFSLSEICFSMWPLRWFGWEKCFRQRSQPYGLSPMCVITWRLRLNVLEKAWSQSSQRLDSRSCEYDCGVTRVLPAIRTSHIHHRCRAFLHCVLNHVALGALNEILFSYKFHRFEHFCGRESLSSLGQHSLTSWCSFYTFFSPSDYLHTKASIQHAALTIHIQIPISSYLHSQKILKLSRAVG